MMPKVSIIITIYNREMYIEECVRSLFEQTLTGIEYILVDDASSDGSIKKLKQTIESYPHLQPSIKIVQLRKNMGVSNARRVGMSQVTGEYVIHADSDDWVDRDMYESLYEQAKKTEADIVGCNIYHEYSDKRSILQQQYAKSVNENIRRLINGEIHPSLCTSLTRTKLISDHSITFPEGLNMGEDLYYNLQTFLYAKKIIGIDFAPYHYRHTCYSSSFHHTRTTIDSGIMIGRKIEELMRSCQRYDEFAQEIEFRKFSLKMSLVINFDNIDNYHYWLNVFPETHRYIWQFKQLDWKLRIELWAAAHRMFLIAKIIKKALDCQYRLRHL
jgi:glycosyltransferase involved in cell wall biosynthesis